MALDTRFACRRYSPPQNPNPIREGGCSGGKRHHAIAGAPSPPRRHFCTARRCQCAASIDRTSKVNNRGGKVCEIMKKFLLIYS